MRRWLLGLIVLLLPQSALALTNLYVDTDSGNNGNACTSAGASACATLAGAIGKLPATLTDAYVIHCKGTAADTAAATTSGKTTDATNTLRIVVDAADRHSGVWSTSHYRLSVADATALTLTTRYVQVVGLQIEPSSATANGRNGIEINPNNATSDIIIEQNIVRGHGNNSFFQYLIPVSSNATVKMSNNIVYDTGTNSSSVGIRLAGASSVVYLHNNTISMGGAGFGIRGVGAAVTSKNNLSETVSGTAFGNVTGTLTNTNCASDDATADDFGGSGNRVSQTFTFAGAGDYHLSSGDSGAKDFGTDLSGDGNYAISVDIDGATRSGSWDIGADEVTVASVILRGTLLGIYP